MVLPFHLTGPQTLKYSSFLFLCLLCVLFWIGKPMFGAFNFVLKTSAASLLRWFVWKQHSPPPNLVQITQNFPFLLSSLLAKICFLSFILKVMHLSLNDSLCLFLLWYLVMLLRSYGPFVTVHYVNCTSVILHTQTHTHTYTHTHTPD